MAIRKIREIGDEVLTKVCKEVTKMTPRTTELIDDMLETMYEAMGVGLAAPQVGILKRIVVIDIGEGPVVMINPRIVESSGYDRAEYMQTIFRQLFGYSPEIANGPSACFRL